MSKRITAKVGSYVNNQNETKGKYIDLGVILSNKNGEFMLLDPSVNLAGVLVQQNILSAKEGKEASDRIMCGLYNNDQQQAPVQQPQYQTPAPQPNQPQPQYQNPPQGQNQGFQ
tara:strand:+ start:4131 stop:4472 length:342 start_codon:yes stop_codon:yes gene_type:complete